MKNTIFLLFFLVFAASCGSDNTAKGGPVLSPQQDSTAQLGLNNRVLGVARIEPSEGISNLTAGVNGRILAVLIDENQNIVKGQNLLNIDVATENAQLNQAQSKIGAQQAAIVSAMATIAALKVSLSHAEEVYRRDQELYEGKALTREQLDESKATMDRLIKDLETAAANQRQSEARIGELQADIAFYKTLIHQKKVTAPLNGKILNVLVKPGEFVDNATIIAEFAPAGGLIAKAEVDELFADRIQLGQRANIRSQTTGETLAEGSVSFAADYLKTKSLFKDQATEQEDRRIREVHIRLESGKMPLIGSRVDCTIFLN